MTKNDYMVRRRLIKTPNRGIDDAPCFAQRATRKSRNKDHFAGGARLEDFFMGARSFGERQLFADHRAQRATFEPGNKAGVDFSFFCGSDSPQRKASCGTAARH